MENKLLEKVKAIYFVAVGVLMYYFLTEIIDLGIYITYRHVFALVLAASGIFSFLFTPNIARGLTAFKDASIYSVPLFITILVSLFIWFTEQVDVEVMSRGLSSSFIYFNMFSFALAAAAFLYIFGERGIWYNLIAIIFANMLMIATIIVENGFGNYFSELTTLIKTFANETGEIIVQAEVHELAFCLGAYLVYMALKPKKNIAFYILLILTLFCFLSAFKRIAIIAIVIAVLSGVLLNLVAKLRKETSSNLVTFFMLLICVILMLYIVVIKMNIFEVIEEMGIDTSGRVKIYKTVDKFYEISAGFLGHGIGFLTYQLNTNINIGVASIHNDFLQYYIDLGFWGYILWLLSMTIFRTWYFGRGGRVENAIITFALTIYLIIVSSTDNTMNYPLLTTVLAILMMGHGFDENVRRTEEKMFGYISDSNRKSERESIL